MGYPFLQELGRTIYKFEITRDRKYKANFDLLKRSIENQK